MGQERMLLKRVKSHKLKYFGHVARVQNLEHDIMSGPVPGKRRQGGQRKQWFDDVTQWVGKDLPTCYRLAEGTDLFRYLICGVAYVRLGVCGTQDIIKMRLKFADTNKFLACE